MRYLITWPTYGNWFAGRSRGGFDVDPATITDRLPEPDLCGEAVGQAPSRWPVVRLDAAQRNVVLDDLTRIASIRDFHLEAALAAPTFIHALMRIEDDGRDMNHLVQLVKGATARALSVAAGDALPIDAAGRTLPHHKWWSRQCARVKVADDLIRLRIVKLLRRRANELNGAIRPAILPGENAGDERGCERSSSAPRPGNQHHT